MTKIWPEEFFSRQALAFRQGALSLLSVPKAMNN